MAYQVLILVFLIKYDPRNKRGEKEHLRNYKCIVKQDKSRKNVTQSEAKY